MIILAMLALAALGTLAFTGWRVMAELRRLNQALARLQVRLAPTLEEIAKGSEAAAERAARMQARAAQRRDGDGAGPDRRSP